MDKCIYDENNGLCYELQGEYYLPSLTLPPEDEKPIGIWDSGTSGIFKSKRKRPTQRCLLASGKRQAQHLSCLDRQAQKRFERLIEQMKQSQGMRNS